MDDATCLRCNDAIDGGNCHEDYEVQHKLALQWGRKVIELSKTIREFEESSRENFDDMKHLVEQLSEWKNDLIKQVWRLEKDLQAEKDRSVYWRDLYEESREGLYP